ncbi:MAG TPA: hypothetical protein VHG91_00855 [Longimicrobium sp.]|nr:hypothetical protein [Longimicrobium sp.]
MRSRTLLLALAALALAAPADAQRFPIDARAVPPRPALFAGADTLDADVYYMHGVSRLDPEPAEAAAAFYWAARLRPGWADALYGRRVALLMAQRDSRFIDYMTGQRNVARAADIQAIDSLYLRALELDPFLFRKLDRVLLNNFWRRNAAEFFHGRGLAPNTAEIGAWIREAMNDPENDMRGWMAYSEGRFPDAIDWYQRRVQRGGRYRAQARTDFARVLFMAGDHRRAAEEMARAVAEMRRQDEKDLIFVYDSKALVEHSLALIHDQLGQADSAREAYGRALQENLAYHPAHVRLARRALAAGDTAAALSELALAAEIAPRDAAVHFEHAQALAGAQKYEEAMEALEKAAEAEPYYAAPHLLLGRIYDAHGMRTETIASLRAYLARAARDEPRVDWARQRADELEAALKAEAGGR